MEDLAKRILDDNVDRKPVKLYVCLSGFAGENSPAQELADALGLPVYAPTHLLFTHSNGGLYLYEGIFDQDGRYVFPYEPDLTQPGEWIWFYPRGAKQ